MRDPWPRLTPPLARCLAAIANTAAGGRCALAVSGGPDSVALAALAVPLAHQAGLQPELWHIHHGLLPMADGWTQQVEQLALSLGVEVCVRRVSVPVAERARLGLEGAARAARREAFAALAAERGCGHVLLAQHLDDQAETVLLRLLRGAGPTGMAAMRPRAEWGGSRLVAWRPWLAVPRHDILPAAQAFAGALDIELADDPSNRDPDLARGWLREAVVPALARHWPGYRQTLARHAELAHEMADWIEQQTSSDLSSLQEADGALRLAGWRQLQPESRRRLVLRRWLAEQGCGMPPAARLTEFERQLLTAADDRSLRWHHDGQVFGVYRGRCLRLPTVATAESGGGHRTGFGLPRLSAGHAIVPGSRDLPGERYQRWAGEPAWECPELGGRLCFDRAPGGLAPDWLAAIPLRLTLATEGGRLRLAANRPTRALKAWFQDAGVPPWERQHAPRLWRGSELLWVAGLGVQCDLPQGEPGVVLRWERVASGKTLARDDEPAAGAG